MVKNYFDLVYVMMVSLKSNTFNVLIFKLSLFSPVPLSPLLSSPHNIVHHQNQPIKHLYRA